MPNRYRKVKRVAQRKNQRNLKRRVISSLLIVLPIILVIGLVMGGWWVGRRLHDPHTLPFHEVRVIGQFHHLNSNFLRQRVQQQIHGGFFSIDMMAIKKNLMDLQWVQDVAIRRMPGTLIVSIREQQPVALWNDHYLINKENQVFLAPKDAPTDLPILQGPDHTELQVLDIYRQINILLQPVNLQVAKLDLDFRRSWQLVLNNGIAVTIGRDDVLPRMQRLVRFYPQLIGEHPENVVRIDLRYQSNVAIEWKKPQQLPIHK